eukprot:jgi/Botrbrau1/10717/Bobra.357_1s0019.1
MQLNDEAIRSFGKARVFKEAGAKINSIDFHRVEDLLFTASSDDTIHVYNIQTGALRSTLLSRKYGVCHINTTHHVNAVLFASCKGNDHALRYLSLYDNKFLRYFKGHNGPVRSLHMSPLTDAFLSASEDRTVRLWDLRTPGCQGFVTTPGLPVAKYDEQGLIFAVGVESGCIKLYDARQYDQGPFETLVIPVEANRASAFSSLQFSPSGKLLSAMVEGRIYLIDSFSGDILQTFLTGVPDGGTPMQACFSPDSQYLLTGMRRTERYGSSTRWGGHEVCKWEGHAGLPTCLKWAPRRQLVASACSALVLHLPSIYYLKNVGYMT